MYSRIGIIGGGIVGLATAYKLQKQYPNSKVYLFEKEQDLGMHQSGRNSGVLHCGLYYEPGSLKAKLAVSGIQQMTDFCREHQVSHEICGKVVVASDEREVGFLNNLAKRGAANGLQGLKFLNKGELKEREPFVVAQEALLVPEEGIVDYKMVMQKLSQLIKEANGEILLGIKIIKATELTNEVIVSDGQREWALDLVVNCTGLHTDRTFKALTNRKDSPIRIVPFRGEYYKLLPEAEKLCNHLIYPVPDPEYPFLGVHFTRMIAGEREVGPNAVFAFKREGYTNSDFSINDTIESLTYKGFLNFVRHNFKFSMDELGSSLFKSLFLKKARKLVPDLDGNHFVKGMAGVRAQAMDSTGKLIMDFRVVREGRQVHVLNAPSPGATASLAIADYIIKEYINESL
ncbi:L-2-hydroxyglutarate oxidase [Pedobacter nyackensis]|uniref:L-2-hydroxyglutarate oxidase n=1 Tax=Pedobacter nyackensis TaxID=475255 RepID=A0A1W2C152_9SPHI|nr:L-2-hydroxyglutarate oxidase [Pedobacter nyackensis]SMC78965.1 L-2-hydroxyglutarate oxidase [Pedobacter nyackensis]